MANQSNNFLLGLWDHEEVFLHAIEHIRHDGVEIYETLTPFPVHGMEAALGYRDTRLHTAGFLFGATGTTFAFSIMTWVMATDYPTNFGGKPYWPVPSFIPVTFELTVLFAAVGMFLTYCVRNKLFPGYVPRIFDVRTTDDRFALVFDIEGKTDAEVEHLKTLLNGQGAVEVKKRIFSDNE